MPRQFKPLSGDPGGARVMEMFDAGGDAWVLVGSGTEKDIKTAAAYAMKGDGSGGQYVVLAQTGGRINNSEVEVPINLMISPEDALQFALGLIQAAKFAEAHRRNFR